MQHISCVILVHDVQVATWHHTTQLWSHSGANNGLCTVHAHPALLMVCDLFYAVYVCVVRSFVIGWWIRMLWRWWRRGRGARATSTASCPKTSAPPWSTSSSLQNSKLVLRALNLGAALPSKHWSSYIPTHTRTQWRPVWNAFVFCIAPCTVSIQGYVHKHAGYSTCDYDTRTVLYWIIC